MKKNNSLQYKIIVLSLILCVFVMSGCNKKEDKIINDYMPARLIPVRIFLDKFMFGSL